MALKLFQARGGFSDGNVSYLSGAGAPGLDAGFQDGALVGSLYSDTATGATYKKEVAGAGTANWVKQASVVDLAGLSATQSWREPAIVRDPTNTTTAAALTEMNIADTLDGITIASGDRLLLSLIAGGAGPNVYIVGGVSGAWTLTEDVNLETAGDTLQVLDGTSAGQIWFFDGTVWAFIGQNSSSEEAFLRTFIGKGAAGAELPAYTSANYVTQGASLESAIGALDAQAALNAAAVATGSTGLNTLQSELDATQLGAGLDINGGFATLTASNYATTATSIVGAITELDTNVAAAIAVTNGNVTTNANGLTALQTEVNTIETGAGLATDGSYVPVTGSNYTNTSTSIVSAVALLDAQAGVNASAIAGLDTRLTTAEATIVTNTGNIATNATSISTLQGDLATEITNRTNADLALDAKIGDQLYASNNVVVNGQSSTAAISALDAALASAIVGSGGTGVNVTVDSVLVSAVECSKWIMSVTDTVTGDKYCSEMFASHNSFAGADATVVDYTEFAELELGNNIAGLVVDVVLSGTGVAQVMQLTASATNNIVVTAKRIDA